MPLGPGQIALTSCRLNQGRLDAFRLNAILAPPVAPSAPVPANGANLGPYLLQWTAGAGTKNFDVYFGTSTTPPLVSSAQTGTSYNLPPLSPTVQYYWQIVARNDFGTTSGPIWTFTAQSPLPPGNPYPSNNEQGVPNTFSLGWTHPQPEPGLTYTVFFGPAPGPPPQVIAGHPSTTLPVSPPLANNTVYIWRVAAVNNAGSTSGPQWTFTTWVLGVPTYLTPPNGAVDVSLSVTFSWNVASNATAYDLYVGTLPNPPLYASNITGTTYTPPAGLGGGTLYYWKVVAKNSGGTTAGVVWSFTTTDVTKGFILINGVNVFPRISGFLIHDNLNDAPNTCTFTIDGTAPPIGAVVQVGLGGTATADLIFAGTIDGVEQAYELAPVNLAWRVSCIDWWRTLNRYVVLTDFSEQSATAIINALISTYAPGFTTGNVAAGLPTVTGGIQFLHEPVGQCLKRIMQTVGGYWYVDYGKDIHAFLTELTGAPDPITPSSTLLKDPPVTKQTDMSQTRTRVLVSGASSQTLTDVPAGVSTIPLEDVSAFRPDGAGVATVATIRIPHTGVYVGGSGSTVRGMTNTASTGPTAALSSTIGGIVGNTDYVVTFKNSSGETAPSPTSNSVTGANVPPPVVGPTVMFAAGLGRIVGTNLQYVTTYQTAQGETLVSPVSSPISPAAVSPPSAPTVNLASGIGYLIGLYNYRCTFLTQYGETTGSTNGTRPASALTAPAAPTVSSTPDNGPLLGTYRWAVAYVTADGRETLGTQTGVVAITATTAQAPSITGDGTTNSIDLRVAWLSPWGESVWSSISTDTNHGAPPIVTPTGMPSDATGWIAFSSGSYTGSSPGVFYRMADVYTGSGAREFTQQTGIKATAAAGTMGKKAALSFTTGPAGTVARRIYRTKAGGTYLFLVAEIPNNTATTHTDVIPDSALTKAAPTQNLNGEQHTIGVPVGPTGTLGRRLYRTVGGGSEYKLLVELPENTTTTWTDNVPDSALGGETVPLVNTAGGQNVMLTVNVGPAGTLARKIYRTKTGGGTAYFFVGELHDNTSTAFTDSVIDAELGAAPPLVPTAGASSVQLSSIPTGPASITARRLYRRDSFGVYRFVAELKDNITTGYLDSLAETELGDVAPTVSTIGALPGSTMIDVASTSPFRSAGGWVTSGSQVIRYTGISGSTLTGIPASGPGSLVSPLEAGAEVIAAPLLTGTTLPAALARGDAPTVLETVNDVPAQEAMIALEGGGTGIYEYAFGDSRWGYKEANAAGTADLRLFSRPIETIRYACRDRKSRSGTTVNINLPSQSISGNYVIQSVTIDQLGIRKGLIPRFTVEASSVRWSFEDLLRQILTP